MKDFIKNNWKIPSAFVFIFFALLRFIGYVKKQEQKIDNETKKSFKEVLDIGTNAMNRGYVDAIYEDYKKSDSSIVDSYIYHNLQKLKNDSIIDLGNQLFVKLPKENFIYTNTINVLDSLWFTSKDKQNNVILLHSMSANKLPIEENFARLKFSFDKNAELYYTVLNDSSLKYKHRIFEYNLVGHCFVYKTKSRFYFFQFENKTLDRKAIEVYGKNFIKKNIFFRK